MSKKKDINRREFLRTVSMISAVNLYGRLFETAAGNFTDTFQHIYGIGIIFHRYFPAWHLDL